MRSSAFLEMRSLVFLEMISVFCFLKMISLLLWILKMIIWVCYIKVIMLGFINMISLFVLSK